MKRIFSRTISILLIPFALMGQSGTLVVLNKSDNTASLIDCASKTPLATIPTGVGPHEVAVSPDGKIAVVANYGNRQGPGNTLTVIDISGRKAIREINLGEYKGPHGIFFFSNGRRVAVTAERNKALLVVDIVTEKVEASINTDQEVSHMVVVTKDDAKAFVANIGSGSTTAVDLLSMKSIGNIVTGAGAEGIDISLDGKEVWITNRAVNTVSVVNVDSLKVIATLESKDFPIRAKFTPDGKHVLVSNARSGEVAVFDARSKKEFRRLKMELSVVNDVDKRLFGDQFGASPTPIGILIPPSGTHAYVANSNADLVTVLDLKEWKVVDRIQTGREPDGLGYSSLVLK